ncbi:MAG: biotin--[acetyl-CoA-carboxylase] ligase [Mariprofundales bacterium]|nr:biotin--[acetyl-CoA-carboxylase] ligase [Mariprofundales bacterium]
MIAPTPLNTPGCHTPWRHLALDCVASTNESALQQAQAGAAEGLVITAHYQTNGRGRLGREWHADYGDSLLMSLLLRPDWLTTPDAPQLSLLTALALYRAVDIDGKRLKWPNDLLINGKKLAGILMEMQTVAGNQPPYIIVGIGVNLQRPAAGWPSTLRLPATTLNEQLNQPCRADSLMQSILREFDHLYYQLRDQGFAAIADQWWQAHGESQPVEVDDGCHRWRGVATGLGSDGALLVRSESGEQRVLSADVTLL